MSDLTQTGFDYAVLPVDIALKAQLAANSIKLRLKRTVEDIIEIGRELTAVKAELPHGQFEIWIKDEFQMNREMANNFMQVATRFGGQMSDYLTFKPTILYALAAPSTPEAVIQQALEKAESGEKVTVDWVKERKQIEAQLESERLRREAAEKALHETGVETVAARRKVTELETQIDLLKREEKPEPVIVEKAPDDYESTKQAAAQLREQLASLKKKQAELVQQQVTAKLREREKELADLERQAQSAEARLQSLNKQIDSYSSIERMTRLQRDQIEKSRSMLAELAANMEGFDPLENDPKTDQLWDALADMLRNGAIAIDLFRGRIATTHSALALEGELLEAA